MENPQITAQALEIDFTLVEKFSNIEKLISTSDKPNQQIFENLCIDILNDLKSRNIRITPSIHKMLAHGPLILSNSDKGFGYFSEEVQENANKLFKNFREHNARKVSLDKNLEDIFARMLVRSDPFILNQVIS